VIKNFKKLAVYALVLMITFGCVPREELDSEDLEPSLDWEEIMSRHETRSNEGESFAADIAPSLIKKQANRLNSEQRRKEILGNVQNAIPFAGGILGVKGSSKYFIASVSTIPEYDRLYWVIVKVLSEKYSCFIRSKYDVGPLTRFVCRDNRQVLFWKKKNGRFIEFISRQFDRDGFEIEVVRKQVVRISNHKVI